MDQEERSLWKRCQRGDREARKLLIIQHINLANWYAQKWATVLHWIDKEDIKQNAYLGLIKAVDRFDVNRGYEFSTYARAWFTDQILGAGEVRGRITRTQARRLRVIRRAEHELRAKLGREPTREEICRRTELTKEQVERALLAATIAWPDLEEELQIEVEHKADRDLTIDVMNCLSRLPEREQELLIYKYWQGLTGKEIGEKLGIEANYVKQLHFRAKKKLQDCLLAIGE